MVMKAKHEASQDTRDADQEIRVAKSLVGATDNERRI